MTEGTLVLSSNRGRYAFKGTEEEPYLDLTSGDPCEILLGGHWIAGSIEHTPVYSVEALPHQEVKGYYFHAHNGGICGLCTRMRVRLP
ncbi:MAG TPA: DUF5348 domain-containing protein [Ktedonobacteraceae bacterium]|nr:DUF5348 domain-containing protein [Ktedonobacteraceae bacterium]